MNTAEAIEEVVDENYLVYGTLRTGHYNNAWCFEGVAPLVAVDTIDGYEMRTHGYFPAIFEAGADQHIVVDVLDISNVHSEVLSRVDGMEFGCGYEKRQVTTNGGHTGFLFVMPRREIDSFPLPIPSGDWNDHEEGVGNGY